MKRFLLTAAVALFAVSSYAQQSVKAGPYQLTRIIENPTTSVKDQYRSSTCWAWSTLAEIESDLIKEGRADESLELSAMWIVRNAYFEKFVKYVRMQGNIIFDEGGAAHDVPEIIAKYGIVRQQDYTGLNYGETNHVHREMVVALKGIADALIAKPKLNPTWQDVVNGILDSYLGPRPEKINVDGRELTPKEYADYLGIQPSKYVGFASVMHAPYGEMFVLEVPDNWMWGEFMNVPLSEFTQIAIDAVKNGYTLAWGSDVSDIGFRYRDGFAVYPNSEIENIAGLERAKWDNMPSADKAKALLENVVEERVITPEYRQMLFDSWSATDDHGMQIMGLYEDARGHLFFKVKNSWAEDSALKGFFYVSIPFFEALSMDYMVNIDALNPDMKAKYFPKN